MKVDVLGCGRVHACRRVHSEGAWLGPLHRLYIQLEHRSELGPEGHAHSIVVKVQNRDLVTLLHQLFELVVELNADQNGVYVDTSAIACTC